MTSLTPLTFGASLCTAEVARTIGASTDGSRYGRVVRENEEEDGTGGVGAKQEQGTGNKNHLERWLLAN